MSRIGRTSIVIGAAMSIVVAAVAVFEFLNSPGRETPVDPIRSLKSEVDVLTRLALSPNGDTLAAASADGHVLVWLLPGRRASVVGRPTDRAATLLSWSPDGLLLCGDDSGLLRAWQQPELKGSRIDSPRVSVTSCVFRQKLADKEMLLGLNDGRIVQIDRSETTPRQSGHRGVKAMLISGDQSVLISAGSEGKLIWYDFEGDSVVHTAAEHSTEIASLVWSPDQTRFVSADWNGELRLWDAATRKITAMAVQPDAVSALSWVDDRLVSGSWDGRIRIWMIEPNRIELSSTIFTGRPIHSLVVEPAGESAFTVSGDGSVRQWNLTGQVTP